MHSEITDLMDAGIRVRYMLFPRAGVGSDSHRKAVAVWCADDQRTAITAAKAGRDPGAASCSNPIESHMKIGRQLGLRGTPFSLTDTGEPINGYMPAKAMLEKLASGR